MIPEIPFVPFPKISRFSRDVILTEKIDGTNAQVYISDDGLRAFAGKRTSWCTLEADNFGFAAWVCDHHDELLALGPGSHFGEWWGAGIQRRYGLTEKRFSLFNVRRWSDDPTFADEQARKRGEGKPGWQARRPSCCHVVPVLWRGNFDALDVNLVLERLKAGGSIAAPGFAQPEGVVIFHEPSGSLFKKTFDRDDKHKGEE